MKPALTASSFAQMVDHTILSPTATRSDIERICEEARLFVTASVCVNPYWVGLVSELLDGSPVMTCSVVGFPLGADTVSGVKQSAATAINDGAHEIDMVVPLGLLLAGELSAVTEHLRQVISVEGAKYKVIIESAALSSDQIVEACRCALDAGADFVKTSTGFHASGGASLQAVELMRSTVGPDVGVKASGGIRSLADVEAMVAAGADRLGMSATAAVIDELART